MGNGYQIVIKNGLGREDFKIEPRLFWRGLLDDGYIEIAILIEHVASIESLPNIHKDPFDRLLLAQAVTEGITLITADTRIAKYPCPLLLVLSFHKVKSFLYII
ncbi:type II toxin-antitoxin system VapC family toxin [Ventosimonas gracilis]|uniref:type II toxin-antitoxin system VapC family toxin n=1 Tax=Ventosimonas gracilis TaxID=1680762 RepID=UPI000ABE62ED|nr:type II toxin-antitoxin system VapC family toxin [Ventosimonas gracilis]